MRIYFYGVWKRVVVYVVNNTTQLQHIYFKHVYATIEEIKSNIYR